MFCEKSKLAANMIKSNLIKTRFMDKSEIYIQDYRKTLESLKNKNMKFDIIFLDPPYKDNIAIDAVKKVVSLDLLAKNGIIIIETDEKEREEKQLEQLEVEVYDLRKYGRVYLMFLNRKE